MLKNASKNKLRSPGEKIEVSLESNAAVISLASFVEGLGWCTQKTIRLDPSKLRDLKCQVDAALTQLKIDEPLEDAGSNVIRFPKMK